MRKIIIVLMVGIVFSFTVTASGNNTFISNFFKQYQARTKKSKISQRVKNVISAEFEKNLPKQLLQRTDITNKIVMTSETENYTDEIIQSFLGTFDEIYDDEKYHKCRIKTDSDRRDMFIVQLLAGKYAKQNSLILQKSLLPLVSNTNNWRSPKAYILSDLIGNIYRTPIKDPGLLSEYMEAYRNLAIKDRDNQKLRMSWKDRKSVCDLEKGVRHCLQTTFSQMSLPELEKLLEKENNSYLANIIILFGVGQQPSDKAAEVYAKYKRKFYGNDLGVREEIYHFKQKCMKYEKWNNRLKSAGYDKQKAEKQYKYEVAAMDKMLKSIPLNNPKVILTLPEKLHKAEDLAGENPESGMFPDRYLKPIVQNPVPECKDAYWQILQRDPDEDKYKIENNISATLGEAYGKVMTKEDVPKVIDYMNKQKSFKLIELMENVIGKDPKKYKKNGTIGIVEGIRKGRRKDIIAEFYKNREKIKDRSMRKGFIEMAEKNGVAN